jgi:SNF2 family DNA or RNA helicase
MLISKVRWIVSGTPIQNSKNDFYSLCDQIGIPQKYYTNPNNLYNIVVKFILIAQEIHSLLSFSNLKISEKNLGGKFGLTTLPLLMRAKQCCVYPKLLQEKVVEIIKHENNELDQDDIKDTLFKGTEGRSKINSLLNKIEERINNNNNKIIFCNYKAEIDIIEKELKDRKIKVEKFDGRSTQSDREKILKDKDIEVLILQIQTGCEGLNLQHFNEIYFVSPHWNPAIEDQAIARAHRIGQDKETYSM